jgi:hypothetical protein
MNDSVKLNSPNSVNTLLHKQNYYRVWWLKRYHQTIAR